MAARALMRRVFAQWPIILRDAPLVVSQNPAVSFIIGHRGTARLPNLLATLRSIAGQSGDPIECIVVEQSQKQEIAQALPPWVRYLHTPVPPGYDYCRSATFNAAAEIARGEVLIAHDNDMPVPHRYGAETLARAREGFEFIDLKRFIFYLSEEDSRAIWAGAPPPTDVAASAIVQNLKGGSIAATREAYRGVGGFDEGFVGWGGEDLEFWERARAYGRVYEFGYLPLQHLWHAPQPGKLDHGRAPAMQRYEELSRILPKERIARLRARR
ncbi:MAG TPA: galactosyltransferase-related protein [Thermoanaerobaculia bacterium]|nr:galactosyltransferase-related protein [Thermoanaerobaculia bacterium]